MSCHKEHVCKILFIPAKDTAKFLAAAFFKKLFPLTFGEN